MAINRSDQNWPDETAVDLEFCSKCYQWHSSKTFCALVQPQPRPPAVQVEYFSLPENWTQDDINRLVGEISEMLAKRGLLDSEPNKIN